LNQDVFLSPLNGRLFSQLYLCIIIFKNIKTNTMATQWKIDPVHSEIQFKVKHLMISTVTGTFESFTLDVETEKDDFSSVNKIVFTADIDSINTKNADRDTHLKSADFFNSAEHPELRFVSNKYEANGDEAKLYGDLTIRGITQPIVLNVEAGGVVVDPYGQTKAGFTVTGKISRKSFGLTWNAVTEAGSVVVSDEIKIVAEVQLVKQASAAAA
jgi:polyisoprenoid-binding protein YceI